MKELRDGEAGRVWAFLQAYFYRFVVDAKIYEHMLNELRAYIEEHHLGPSKHTSLYNHCRYFKRKMKEGVLDEEKAKELEDVLGLRDLSIHTGGRRKQQSV